MTFLEHLEELRKALIRSAICLFLGSAICLFFAKKLYHWLQAPLAKLLPAGAFQTTGPIESYTSYFKVALVCGLLLSSPFIFYFIWNFIRPGLNKREKRGIVPLACLSGALFAGGALFGYFIVFPPGFEFAVELLKGTGIELRPKMDEYLSLALHLLIAFGITFELPLLMLALARLGLLRKESLSRSRKYAVVVIFLAAGILTPGPDIPTQVLMALPLLLLFEVGIVLVKLFATPRRRG